MILRIDTDLPVPPYAQVQDQITTMVRSGVLAPGTRLPAIRHLAHDLGVAANTIGRAYRELERAGLVTPQGHHGTVVREPPTEAVAPTPEAVDAAAGRFALEAAHRGLDLEQALDAVRRAFGGLGERGRLT